MKNIPLTALLLTAYQFAFSQGTWTQRTNFPGSGTHETGSFTINGKAYIVGGAISYPSWSNETWEYDPTGSGTWTQKANVPATGLREPVAFSIGIKGYAGTGMTGTSLIKNFYEYDPAANTWTAKANFSGTARRDAMGFSIGAKGYIGTGADASNSTKDFYEYDPVANTWTAKLAFGGLIRNASTGFSIGTKGYVTTGRLSSTTYNDLWEYDPTANTWSQKANYSGVTRSECAVFVIGTSAYVGLGHTGGITDFRSYDAASNTWSTVTNFPGTGAERFESVGFSIGNKGYVCGGVILGSGTQTDLWEYDPTATGMNEQTGSVEILIYPNPASDRIAISCADKILSVIVYDVNGNEIYSQQHTGILFGKEITSLDVRDLASGIYFLKATSQGGASIKRISVVR